ncbi:MAG: twin-arginine translocation signal domain-containing protein [Anaerolineales bacterium]|nr:twin-arginine translocation signal domain-containing protein [Anaerolineales bacterium]
MSKKINRRDFLRALGIAGGGIVAGACATQETPTPETITVEVTHEVTREVEKEVEKVVTPTPGAEDEPWAYEPAAPKPEKIVYVRAFFEDIFNPLAEKFEEDWGVPVEILYQTNNEEAFAKALTLYATGEQVDAMFLPIMNMGTFLEVDSVLPINAGPGFMVYVNDFNPVTESSLNYEADLYAGLPQGMMNYVLSLNRAKLEEAGIEKPYTSWNEMVDQCLKAKTDGVAEYPYIWVAGLGSEQLPGTFFSLVWNRGGVIFESDGTPALGPGSVARETLDWWRRTFLEWEISDPLSLEVRFIPAAQAFGTGDYLYLGPQHDGIAWTQQDPAQYPAADTTEFMMMPGTGATLGFAHQNVMLNAAAETEWAWKWMQYIGGKTKDGEWLAFEMWAERQGTIPNYKSITDSPMYLDTVEGKSSTLDIYIAQTEKATAWKEAVPVTSTTWYPKWADTMNVKLQECLRGEITADECCDDLIAAVDEAKATR